MSSVTMRSRVEVPAPFAAADLVVFLANTPDNARLTVSTLQGGSQRDPYPVGFIFAAEWEMPDA